MSEKVKSPIESKRFVLSNGTIIDTIKSNLPLVGRNKTARETYEYYKKILCYKEEE